MWMGFDESDDYFKVADVGSEDGTTSGNISSVTPTNMMVGKLAVDSSANYLDVTSSDLTATAGQDFVVDAARDIILDAAGNDVMFKANGTQFLKLTNNSGDVEIFNGVADKDILFKDLAGNEVFRMDGSAESLLMASSKRLQLGAAEKLCTVTELTFTSKLEQTVILISQPTSDLPSETTVRELKVMELICLFTVISLTSSQQLTLFFQMTRVLSLVALAKRLKVMGVS